MASEIEVQEPVTLKEGRFIDEDVAQKLAAANFDSVPVKITKEFQFGRWEHRWWFLVGILAMALGIFFLRKDKPVVSDDASDPAAAPGPQALKQMIVSMTGEVENLSARVDSMSGDEIRAALDPLFDQYGQPFVEGRNALTASYGGGVFAQIMGPFASAERRLNRSWSAAVDGYMEESREQLKAAVPYLKEAEAAFPG